MIIDHIGIVVRSLDEGVRSWQELFGYKTDSEIVTNTRQMVKVVFLSRDGSVKVKLIEPSESASSVTAFARRGGGLHHLCFLCDDMRTQIPLLEEKGARVIVKPQPGEAFGNRDIAFLLAPENLNIELIDSVKRAIVL